MINKEVIIFQIEDMLSNINKDNLLLNGGRIDDGAIFLQLMTNILALLKEQEAVEPILEQDSVVCGVCGHEIIWQKMLGDGIWADERLDYCPHCGRKVKWND